MGNGVSAPPGGAGLDGPASALQGSPFVSSAVLSSASRRRSSRLHTACEAKAAGASVDEAFYSAVDPPKVPSASSCALKGLPLPLPLLPALSDSALPPPPSSTRSEPPYLSPWLSSSPDSLSPCSSCPAHPPSRRSSRPSSAFGRGSPDCSRSGTTLIPEAASHALRDKNLDAISGLPPASDMAYGVLCPGAVSCTEDNGPGAFLLDSAALPKGRENAHLAAGDSSLPMGERAAGGEGCLVSCFPPALSREAISAYIARSSRGYLLEAVRQEADNRCLSDDEMGTLPPGGADGSGSSLVADSPAIGAAERTKNSGALLSDHLFLLPAASGGAPAVNPASKPLQTGVALSPSCLSCPTAHSTSRGATGTREAGQIVSRLAGCVEDALVSEALKGTLQPGETVPWGVAGGKVEELDYQLPCAEAGANSLKGRNFFELAQNGAKSRGRDPGTIVPPRPDPFAWPAGGTGSLRGGRGLSTRSSRGRGRSATSATSSASKKSLGKSGVLENPLSFGVPPPSQKTRGFLLSPLPSAGLPSPLLQGSSDPAVNARCIHRACEANDVAAFPDGNSRGPADTWGGSRASLVSGSCGEPNSASSTASGGAGDGGPGLRRGRSCLEEVPSTGGGRPDPALFASSTAPGDVYVGQAANDTADGHGGPHVLAHDSSGLASVSGASATAKTGDGGDRPAACYQCCNCEHVAPLSAPAGRSRPSPTWDGRAEDDPDVLIAAGQAGAVSSYACCSETASNLYSRRSAALAASPGPAGCTCCLVRSGNPCGGTMPLAKSAPLAEEAAAVDVTRCFLHSRARDSAARDIAGSCESADGVLFKVRGGGVPRERGEKDDAFLGGKRGKHHSSFSPGQEGRSLFAERPTESDGDIRITERRRHSAESFTHLPLPASPHLVLAGRNKPGGLWNADVVVEASERGRPQRECCVARTGTLEASAAASLSALRAKTDRETHTGIAEEQASIPGAPLSQVISGGGGGRSASGTGKVTGVPLLFPKREEKGGCSRGHGVGGNVNSASNSGLAALSGDLTSSHLPSCALAKCAPPGSMVGVAGGAVTLPSAAIAVSSASGFSTSASGAPFSSNTSSTGSSGGGSFSHSSSSGGSGGGALGGGAGPEKNGSGGTGGSGGPGGGGKKGGPGGGGGGSHPSSARDRGAGKECQSVDFYVRSFWKVAKTQNDLESPTQGYCRGFVYRLLLHPRGTTGTDSEASHLSVFLEAIRQDWYPDDWIFPNVRFELTVVNFKDPKQSVTSWAHWSFSNEATSRGWQKMISHARLNKQSGFMDEDGTVLVRGKAEPPFASLWSRGPVYRPHRIWEYIPERAAKALEEVSSSCSAAAAALTGANTSMQTTGQSGNNAASGANANNMLVAGPHSGAPGGGLPRLKTPTASLLSYVDPIVPTLDSSLGADYVALFVHCLFHLCEFRKHVYMWKSDFIKAPTVEQLAQDPSLAAQIPPFADGSLIGALQQTFAYMQLWPVTVACRRLQHLAASSSSRKEICASEIWKWYGAELFPKNSPSRRPAPPPLSASASRLAFCTLCKRCTCCCRCKTTAYHAAAWSAPFVQGGSGPPSEGPGRKSDDEGRSSGGTNGAEDPEMLLKQMKLDRDTCLCCDLMDRYPEAMIDMPPQPNIKAVLKALHMHDVQKMDVPDPLVKVHTELFSLLMRELAKTKLETHQVHEYQARAVAAAAAAAAAAGSGFPSFSSFGGRDAEGGEESGLPSPGGVPGGPAPAGIWTDVDGVAFTSCDHLEATCHELFSSSDRSTGLLNADGVPDISAGFTRCKHVHSLQKALESCGKVLQHFPEVLFVYLQSVKQCKKGELFDAPLRLDAHKLLQLRQQQNANEAGNADSHSKGNGGEKGAGTTTGVVDREKQRRRLRKKLQQSRKGNKVSRDAQEEESDITEDEELAISDEDDLASTQGDGKGAGKGDAKGGQGAQGSGQTSAQGGAGTGPGGPGSTPNHGGASAGNVGNQEKWFSLFALFIREGDSRGDGCGAQTSHYLLLRPEEDGPWFRIGDGRVERLSSKVDFTEWKCHRDFFCAGAVYVAEDYIDAVQAGDVDLSGDLLELNPWLYYRTLYDLGITEAEIKRPWINLANNPSGATAVSGSACSSPVGGSGARASGEALASLEGDGHAKMVPGQRDGADSERQLGLAAADAGKTGAESGGLVSGTASPFSCPSAASGVPAVSSSASVVPGVRPFFEGDGNVFHESFESAWRPRTLAEERRYTVLAPVIKWIFEVAVEKAVVFAANSPELVENHYWFVLRMQYLEKILLLELRHAICEVLYDEWLTNYVTPFVAHTYKSALTQPKVHALEREAKNADVSASDDAHEEGLRVRKLLAAISFFFRDDEEGGTAAATAVMSASRSGTSAVELASDVSSASGEKGEATGEKTPKGNRTASVEEEQASPGEEKERGERTESLASSPTHVGPREAAEVIAHWARTHLSDNGRLLVDELGTLLKDPLHRLVDRISTLRHEVEILCREGRSRSLLYRVGAGATADACTPRDVQPTPSEKQIPPDSSALQKEDEKSEKDEKGGKSEGDEKGKAAGEDVPEPEALAELRQAVTERLTDLWTCCRECVKESEEILSKFTVERLRTSAVADPEAEEERRTSERKSEETSAVAGSGGDKHRRDATKSGGGAGEEKESRSGADAVSPAPNEPSFSPLPPSLPPSAADPSRCVERSAALSAGRATGGALDHLGHEYDLSTRETIELVAFLSEAFFLPDFRTMRRFLRDRRHLVFERIRPHELIRAYLSLARPEVHLPSFLHEHGYNVTWCEAAFQPEDVSAIWGDASVPDVVAVQSVSRGFQLRRAVSSVLLHLLVTALECGPSESGLKPRSQGLEGELGDKALARATDKTEKDGAAQAKGSATGTADGSSVAASSKKGKKKKGAKEEVEKKAKADEPGEGTATSPKEGDERPSEEPDPLRGEDIRKSLAADVSAILRAMEHDCPDLASPTSLGMPAAVHSQVDSASGTSASAGDAPEASTPGLLRDIPSPPPEASSASGGQQAVLGGETVDYQSQLATIPKIPLTLPLPGSGEKNSSSQASGTGGKCGKKKGRVCGLGGGSSSGSGDPTHVVPVLDRVLPRLNFEQRIAAAADPGVFLLCPAALSSSLSSFAPSPRASCSLTSPAGGAGTPAFSDVLPDAPFAAKPGSANSGGFGSAFASGSCPSGAAHASALERELLGLGDGGVVPFPTCGTIANRGLNGGAGSAFLTGNSVCRRIRYHGLELGLLLAEDLKGLEGFSIEDSLPIRARLLVRKSVLTPTGGSHLAGSPAPTPLTPPVSSPSSASPSPSAGASALHAATQPPPAVSEPLTVQRLYWAFRRLLHAQIEECDVGADDAAAGASFAGAGKGKNPSTVKACEQQLALLNQQSERELWWLPTPRDAFLLYALRPDPDPTRKGRRRFVYMDPLDDLEIYADPKRQLADSSAPDITILLVAAPQRCCLEASAWLKGSTFSSAAITAAASAVPGVVLPPPALTFPLEDADEFPLLVFKWFSADSVDLFCVGALVCDAKQQLQTYILDWLVPHVRARGYLSPLPSSTMKDDAENFLVLEECHLRTVQNIRRWSCAIRKINKRGGDVIIVQKKGLIESPASIRYRESSALLEKVRLYEVAHHHCGDGVGGEFDLGEGVASASLPPLASTVSGAAGSGDFLLEGNDILSIPADGAGGAGDRVLCAAHLHNLDEGEGDDGAGGGGKKKKKKQKKVLPRAAIPSNRKSVIARLAEDQRREETTLLKAAAKGQEKDYIPLEDTAVQAAAPPSAGASPSASSADKKSAAAGSAVSEEEEDVRATGSTTAAKTAKGGKKATPDDSKGDRTKSAQASVSPEKEGTLSGKKAASVANLVPGKSSSSASPAAARTSGGGVAEAANGKQKGTAGGASSSEKAVPSEKSGETGDKKTDGSSQSEGAPSAGTKVSSVEASAVGSKKGKKEAAETATQATVEESSATGPGEDKREDASGENTLGVGVAWPASAHLGSVSASSPPLSPASSTISRGSSFSIVALPGAIQMRLSPASQQLLQRVSDKQHMASPALLREAAAILVDEFISRVSQIYRNAAMCAIGGDSGLEKKGGVETRTSGETLGGSESAGGSGAACGAGAPASASWAVLVGAGIGSVAVDEISECAESLEAICSTCFSTQQRPIFIKEIQVLLDREIHGQGAAEPEAGEKRLAGARKGDSGEKGAKASGASAAAMARPKKEGFYSGVAAGKASSAAQEASASDARLAAFYRLFSCRRRAASELFALLSVTRGGQLVTRKLVAQYCLAALDKDTAGGSAASSPLLSVASVILMWLFLGPRLICKLGDSQQGRRFIDGGLRKIFDFFQQRTALSLQLQQTPPASLLSSPTALGSTPGAGGRSAPQQTDPVALVAWAAGVLLKVFHLSRASQLVLPRQTDVLSALQQIQLPSAFLSKALATPVASSPSSVWGTGGAGLLAAAGGAGTGTAVEAHSASVSGDNLGSDSTSSARDGKPQASAGRGGLLLPPLSASVSAGGSVVSGPSSWGSSSTPAESSTSAHGLLEEAGGKKASSQRASQPPAKSPETGGSSPVAAARAAGGEAAGGEGAQGAARGLAKGSSSRGPLLCGVQHAKGAGVIGASPSSPTASGAPGKLVAAVDEREDSDDEENEGVYREEGEEEPADLQATQEEELVVGEQSLYGSGKALSRRVFKKAAPYVVEEGSTWMVLYKPAFWHCSGFGRDRPVFVPRVATPQELEEALAHISLEDMISSGKIESFHLYMMKKYPRLETVRRWEEMECGLCHRTDLETSGSLLIAKTRRARESIFEQFRKRLVHKEYLLLCHGRLDKLHARIDHPIATRDFDSSRSKSHFSEVVGPDEGGDEALTEYQVVRVFGVRQPVHRKIQAAMSVAARIASSPSSSSSSSSAPSDRARGSGAAAAGAKAAGSGKGSPVSGAATKKDFSYSQEFSFCRVRIHTGRTHQIRVHFRHIGHPLVGDTKYCDLYKCTVDRSWCARMFLHSAVLEFDNPDKTETQHVRVVCPLATELLAALENELVCLEDYSQITGDMLDRTGQVKKEYRHLVVSNPTGPPDGSVPGYSALPAGASSPSSSRSGPLLQGVVGSSPPLLPVAPAALAAEGRLTPSSPLSLPPERLRDTRAPTVASAAAAASSPPKAPASPPVSKSSPVILSSEKSQKAGEPAPVTLPGRALDAREAERKAEQDETRMRDAVKQTPADEKKPAACPSSENQPPLLPVELPSRQKDALLSPSSGEEGARQPPMPPVLAPAPASNFSGIFDSLLDALRQSGEAQGPGSYARETRRSEAREDSQASAFSGDASDAGPVGLTGEWRRRRYLEEADWSVADICQEKQRETRPGGDLSDAEAMGRTRAERQWSYREFATDLADLMRLPSKEEDASGLRRLTEAVATAVSLPTVREEEQVRQYWGSVHAAQRLATARSRERMLGNALQALVRLLHLSELQREVLLPASLNPQENADAQARGASASASAEVRQRCRYIAFDSRSGELVAREDGHLLIPSFSDATTGALGGVQNPQAAGIASLNSVAFWKVLLESLGAHYPADICVRWDADKRAILVLLLLENTAEMRKISQAAASQGPQQQAAAQARAFLDFHRALRDLSKFESATPALARAVGNAPLPRDSLAQGRGEKVSDGRNGGSESKEAAVVVVGPLQARRRGLQGATEESSASLWRMQAWRKYAPGGDVPRALGECELDDKQGFRSRFPLGDLPPFRQQMGLARAPDIQFNQPPLLPHTLGPAHVPMGGISAHPHVSDFHSSAESRPQHPLLASGVASRLGQGLTPQERQFLLSQQSGGSTSFLLPALPSLSENLSGHDSSGGRFDASQRNLLRLPGAPGSGAALGSGPGAGLVTRPSWAPSVWGSPGAGTASGAAGAAGGDGALARGLGAQDGGDGREDLRRGPAEGSAPMAPFVFLWEAEGEGQADATPPNNAEVQEEEIRDLMDLSFMMGSTPSSGHGQTAGPGSVSPSPETVDRGGSGVPGFESLGVDEARGDTAALPKLPGRAPTPGAKDVTGIVGEGSRRRNEESRGGLGQTAQQGQDESSVLLRDMGGELREGVRHFSQDQASAAPDGSFMSRLPREAWQGSSGILSSASKALSSASSPTSSLLSFGQPGALRSSQAGAGPSLFLMMGQHGGAGGERRFGAPGETLASSSASVASGGTRTRGQTLNEVEGTLQEAPTREGEGQVLGNDKWSVRVDIPHPPSEAPPHPSIMFLHQKVAREMLEGETRGTEGRRGAGDEGDNSGPALAARAAAALLSRQYCNGAAVVENALHDQLAQQRRVGDMWGSSAGSMHAGAAMGGGLGRHGAGEEVSGVDEEFLLGRRNSTGMARGVGPGAGGPRPSPSPPGNMPVPPAHIHPSLRSHLASATAPGFPLGDGTAPFGGGRATPGISSDLHASSGGGGLIGRAAALPSSHMNAGGRPVFATNEFPLRASNNATDSGRGRPFAPSGFCGTAGGSATDLGDGDLRGPLLPQAAQDPRLHALDMRNAQPQSLQAPHRMGDSLLGAGGLARLPALGQPGGPNAGPSSGNSGREDEKA